MSAAIRRVNTPAHDGMTCRICVQPLGLSIHQCSVCQGAMCLCSWCNQCATYRGDSPPDVGPETYYNLCRSSGWKTRNRPSIVSCAGLTLIHPSQHKRVSEVFAERHGTSVHQAESKRLSLDIPPVKPSEVGSVVYCTGREMYDLVEPIQRDHPKPGVFRARLVPVANRFIADRLSHNRHYQLVRSSMPEINFNFNYVMQVLLSNLEFLLAVGDDYLMVMQVVFMPTPLSMGELQRQEIIQKFKTHSIGPTCNGKADGNEPWLHTVAREMAEEMGLTMELHEARPDMPKVFQDYMGGKSISKTQFFLNFILDPRPARRTAFALYYHEALSSRARQVLTAEPQRMMGMFACRPPAVPHTHRPVVRHP